MSVVPEIDMQEPTVATYEFGDRDLAAGVPGFDPSPFGVDPTEATAWLSQGDANAELQRVAAHKPDGAGAPRPTPHGFDEAGPTPPPGAWRTTSAGSAGLFPELADIGPIHSGHPEGFWNDEYAYAEGVTPSSGPEPGVRRERGILDARNGMVPLSNDRDYLRGHELGRRLKSRTETG